MPTYDSVLSQTISVHTNPFIPDSLHQHPQVAATVHAVGNFFSDKVFTVPREQVLMHAQHQTVFPDWILYVFAGLLAVYALIRFYYPATIKMYAGMLQHPIAFIEKESALKQGFLFSFFQFVSFLVNMGLLLYVLNLRWMQLHIPESGLLKGMLFWSAVVFIYFVVNQAGAWIVAFIFQTFPSVRLQTKIVASLAYILGGVLTPVLFFYFYTFWSVFLYLAVVIVVIVLVLKWIQLFKIGLTHTGYAPVHLFLYLCALEIIPVILLIKLAVLQV